MDDRLCICNMAIEAGAKNGIFEVDDVTRAYVKDRVHRPYQEYHADADAEYVKTYDIDLSAIRPTVAFPHCRKTRIRSMRSQSRSASIRWSSVPAPMAAFPIWRLRPVSWRAKHVAKGVRCIIIPATQSIYKECVHRGYMDIFIDAGCVVSTPTCGPCLGGYRESWQKESAASPRPTAISSAAWDMWILRSIWPARPSRLPARSPGVIAQPQEA